MPAICSGLATQVILPFPPPGDQIRIDLIHFAISLHVSSSKTKDKRDSNSIYVLFSTLAWSFTHSAIAFPFNQHVRSSLHFQV